MSQSEPPELSGILVIDKPAGLTSHDVVARVRRALGIKRVGHGGTLDPFATGVLPVAVGPATRILQYVQASRKEYVATLHLGQETDSGDIDGEVISESQVSPWPALSVIHDVLARYVGRIEQIPPALSAIKVGGQPLHRRVRAGESVEVPPRVVEIVRIEVTAYAPPEVEIAVVCGSGTYVRALVRDIGRSLGTYAYCHALRRTRAGPFSLDASIAIDEFSSISERQMWGDVLLSPDTAVGHLPAVRLDESSSVRWYHGRSLTADDAGWSGEPTLMRLYDNTGRFAGIGETDSPNVIVPRLVFTRQPQDGNA